MLYPFNYAGVRVLYHIMGKIASGFTKRNGQLVLMRGARFLILFGWCGGALFCFSVFDEPRQVGQEEEQRDGGAHDE